MEVHAKPSIYVSWSYVVYLHIGNITYWAESRIRTDVSLRILITSQAESTPVPFRHKTKIFIRNLSENLFVVLTALLGNYSVDCRQLHGANPMQRSAQGFWFNDGNITPFYVR